MDTELHERMRAAVGARTFRHLSELTGTHHETVRRYMQGQAPSVEFVSALCGALGLNANWMLTGRGPMRQAEVRAASLQQADASELLAAMATTIEVLIKRVERLEVFLQTMEVRLRAAPVSSDPSRGADHGASRDQRPEGSPVRARAIRIGDALAERKPQARD
ncbi:MAG: hypothetical protein ACF8SC_02150 [Phycisphaerales bacterium JB037]